ncbi:MAG: tetratricopeptide repeat protein [Flavobacteriales bacterium]|nr:tetratricopeptide repeat protein [Flavobacteriales bacterium]
MKQNRIIILVLFGLSFLLYLNTLKHGYVLDDFSVIKENFIVKKGTEGISEIWKTHYRYGYGYQTGKLYRPLSFSLFAIQWEIAPDSPELAHSMNVFLYAVLACLLFIFLVQLLGKQHKLLSFIATLLFIAHPIHTEVVANIKSVDDILVFILSVSAYLFLFHYLKQQNKLYLLGSLFLMGLAFFAKESTITLIAMIPFMLVLFKELTWKRAILLSSWYSIPTFVFLFARYRVLGSMRGSSSVAKLDNLLMGASSELERIATAFKIMGLYLWKLVFPHPLMNDYSTNQISLNGFESPFAWLSIVIFSILIWLVINFWKSNKIISFALLFFLITFSLYTNLFITIGTSFGERLLFIPSLGFSLLLAYFVLLPFKNKIGYEQVNFKKAKAPLLITALLISIYAFKTIDRNKDWKDNFTLYSTDVINCDKSARCHYYHGIALMKHKAILAISENEKQAYLLQAITALKKAIEILPGYSDAYGDLGLAYYRLKNYKEAEKAYLKSTELNPSNANSYSNLGSLYFEIKNYQAARVVYEKAIKANPNHIDALANYASTLGTLGEFNAAITYFKRAIAIKPNEANYYQMVGITYQNLGNQQQAQIYLQKAKQLR